MAQNPLLRVALVGAGRMASHHARAIARCGLGDLVAVSDPDPTARQRFLSSHPECRAYESLTQLIEAAQPQVAHICTPGQTHSRRDPDLRVIWLPGFMVGPLALALRIIQRLLRPRRSPLDIRKAFDQRSFAVEAVRELIDRMSGASGRLAGSDPEILVSAGSSPIAPTASARISTQEDTSR